MKVLVNSGINLSELDGWWAEAYTPEVGWALGDGQEHGDDPAWDAIEPGALYDLLEWEVIPEFYKRDQSGIPTVWVKRMRESMAQLSPRFSTNRTVREYTEQHYLPAAATYHQRLAAPPFIAFAYISTRTAFGSRSGGHWALETYASTPTRITVKRVGSVPDSTHLCDYHATISTVRSASDYTARVIPQRSGVAVPLECARILWQR